MNRFIDQYAIYLILPTLPIALIVFWLCVLRNKVLLGRFIGIGIILLPTVALIEYFDKIICRLPGEFCELTGLLYIFLLAEAVILILLFLGLGLIIRKSFQPR